MRPETVRPEAPVTAEAGVGEVGSLERGGGGEVWMRLATDEEGTGVFLSDAFVDSGLVAAAAP